jgi:hypothetical protein
MPNVWECHFKFVAQFLYWHKEDVAAATERLIEGGTCTRDKTRTPERKVCGITDVPRE